MGTESNRCFGLIISGVGRGVEWGSDWGGCSLPYQNVSGLWFDIEEETTASNNCIGCNFKPFKG